jgi:hypothetical protein
MIQRGLARCGRTSRIVAAILDGVETPVDRAHIAACAMCGRESERAVSFTRSLPIAAAAVGDGIPDPVLLRRQQFGVRIGGYLRMGPVATLAGAVAVGLLVATVIGTRSQPPASPLPNAFASPSTATEGLAPLGFVCGSMDVETLCRSAAPDHVHLVTLTVTDGLVVGVEARIESTDGTDLDLRGVDDLLARIAAAVLTPDVRTAATDWIRDAYPTCGGSCSSDREEIGLAMARERHSVTLTLRER